MFVCVYVYIYIYMRIYIYIYDMHDWSSKHSPLILDKFHLCLPGWEHLSGCTVHHCINESKWSHRLAMLTECLYVYIYIYTSASSGWLIYWYISGWLISYLPALPENSDSNWTWRLQPSNPWAHENGTASLRRSNRPHAHRQSHPVRWGSRHIPPGEAWKTARLYPGAVKKIGKSSTYSSGKYGKCWSLAI